MKYRDEHCIYAVLNQNGKCIAPCHHNKPDSDVDCIGRTGKTMGGDREVPIGMNLKLGD